MASSRQLTQRQNDVYILIRNLISQRGYGPTVREIADHFGIRSPNGVMCHLRAIERKGLIRRSPNKSRAIELTLAIDRSPHNMPMVGRVGTAASKLAFESDQRVNFGEMLYGENRFVLQVSGDSMIDSRIADGDYVIVQRCSEASSGQLVVAEIPEGQATLKYWYPEAGRIRLQPANTEMQPVYVREARVIGLVVGVVRSL